MGSKKRDEIKSNESKYTFPFEHVEEPRNINKCAIGHTIRVVIICPMHTSHEFT